MGRVRDSEQPPEPRQPMPSDKRESPAHPQNTDPFNPLGKRHLGESVAKALLESPVSKLPPPAPFTGAGLYAIYYSGRLPLYKRIASLNRRDRWAQPIYVGKAVPAGARRGGYGLGENPGTVLFGRLKEHAESIRAAASLAIDDFACRYLVVDDIWIPLGESLLIQTFRPLWNTLIDGFGNHTPGEGRFMQRRSPWDTLHPGRTWALRCVPGAKTAAKITSEVEAFLGRPPAG